MTTFVRLVCHQVKVGVVVPFMLMIRQGCDPTSTCCTFNNPPWFCKQLAQSTSADLEVRFCSASSAFYENTPVELIEIYVK